MRNAIQGNLDLKQALLRVVEARQGVVSARAAGLPTLNATGSYSRELVIARGLLESEGVYNQINTIMDPAAKTAINGALGEVTTPVSLSQYGLDASWELDLFGRVRRSVEQAKATTEAQVEAANDSLVTLEGEIAMTYIQLRGAQTLVSTQRDNIGSSTASLELTQRRRQAGLATDLDVDQARTQLTNDERQLPPYETQVEQAINQLSVLSGKPPGSLDGTLKPPTGLPHLPSLVALGVPAALARRRPDIREAEANLHAATANTGIATASFYPDISLTGNIGIQALDARYLTNWASHFYSFGPSVSLPIFQGGKLTANLRLARAQQAESALRYRSTVLNALNEVENALVAYRNDRIARDKLAETVRLADDTVSLSTDQYKNGLADFLTVLNAQVTLNTSRQNYAQMEVTVNTDVITLYKALGGGWQNLESTAPVPVIDATPPPLPAALDGVAASTSFP